jgi:3-methyladenine DNA glycosylase AlkD
LTADDVRHELAHLAIPENAPVLQKFFQAFPGGYGEGDTFLGVRVPEQRKLARRFRDLPPEQLSTLLRDTVHEHRLTGFFILVKRFEAGDAAGHARCFELCRRHLAGLNNWDLVDSVAPVLIGPYLAENPAFRPWLDDLSRSRVLWERRISILSTLAFIRAGDFTDTLRLAERLLHDEHDLMHKAVGWMLREVGKRDLATEEAFLDRHAHEMPRTALRYAIERFAPDRRQHYLQHRALRAGAKADPAG